MDWGQPYSCTSWAETFGQTFPILDDNNGSSIYGLFGVGYVPHNAVIGGDGQVIFSESGFNQNTMIAMIEEGLANLILDVDEDGILDSDDNCIDIANPNQDDIDLDGSGDACDPCDNQNVYTFGNINGTIDQDGFAIVDIFDIMELVDILLNDDQESCGSEIADMNSDGNQNVVDIIFLVQMLLGGNFESILPNYPGLLEIENNGSGTKVSISNDSKIGGFQFTTSLDEVFENDLSNLILPEGWVVEYVTNNQKINVLIFDISGQNSVQTLDLKFSAASSNSFQNIVLASGDAQEIEYTVMEKDNEQTGISPDDYQLYSLYPNPFNPSLNIYFSIATPGKINITIYNSNGQKIGDVLTNEYLQRGNYNFSWDADKNPSGLYFVKLKTQNFTQIKKALFLK
ncbi:T9SS type A sorting domain-containing protein [Candidatus Marinimicrobia bacterium]|nr:T9SS type A sorting domain-containing protein [Candidatus Neomarinimicrobiota bacterium]MDC3166307.1 T9SS type A sorting domain-containing protein [Candidatus Neomarinimicrobiota bacterium]